MQGWKAGRQKGGKAFLRFCRPAFPSFCPPALLRFCLPALPLCLSALLLLCLSAFPVSAQGASLGVVLERAGAYVTEFRRQLSGIVAEERYVQEVLGFHKRNGCPSNATYQSALNCQGQLVNPMRTELRSDLLLVRIASGAQAEFRDVFEADGVPVRDRTERLTKLFLGNSAHERDQIRQILAESSRLNIGDIQRNINTPVFALQILEPANQPRFAFKRSKNRVPDTFKEDNTPTGAFRTSTEIWVIEYRETQSGTVIRTSDRQDFPARGRFWIEPSTGRVLMSELIMRNRTFNATIDVSYQSEPLVGLLVPAEMREEYKDRAGSHITGVATYGRFRQFAVNVDETFLIKE